MHEHIVLGYAGWFYDPRCAEFDHAKAEEKDAGQAEAPARLRVKFGGGSRPIELGRNPVFMQEMSVKSGVQNMCSTGFDFRGPRIFVGIPTATAEEIRDIYLYEIENGIGPERIKPGIIKVATGYGQITDYEDRCIHAACMAKVFSLGFQYYPYRRGRWGPNRLVLSSGMELRLTGA